MRIQMQTSAILKEKIRRKNETDMPFYALVYNCEWAQLYSISLWTTFKLIHIVWVTDACASALYKSNKIKEQIEYEKNVHWWLMEMR